MPPQSRDQGVCPAERSGSTAYQILPGEGRCHYPYAREKTPGVEDFEQKYLGTEIVEIHQHGPWLGKS